MIDLSISINPPLLILASKLSKKSKCLVIVELYSRKLISLIKLKIRFFDNICNGWSAQTGNKQQWSCNGNNLILNQAYYITNLLILVN